MDTASWVEDFEDWMIPFYQNHPTLKIHIKFGRKDDSLEFRLGDKNRKTIDLFWMYPGPEINQSWVGVQVFDGKYTKKIEVFPRISDICSADLHGFLVFVPCDSFALIKAVYGKDSWFSRKSNYDYKKEASNSRVNGTWTKKQWEGGEVYEVFQKSGWFFSSLFSWF